MEYDSKYTLSVNDNDLIIYEVIENENEKEKKKYVCYNSIKPKTKKTKRLLYALTKKFDLSIEINHDDLNKLILSIKHPLYDDDIYTMHDIETINQQDDNLDINQNDVDVN